MTQQTLSDHPTMESAGFYNRNSARQAVGAALALPIFEAAARSVVLDDGDAPVVIADYGVSQGRNSLAPVRVACRILRARIGASRPIGVVHSDLPTNDFSTLFQVLEIECERCWPSAGSRRSGEGPGPDRPTCSPGRRQSSGAIGITPMRLGASL
jgi:hypothetical protein